MRAALKFPPLQLKFMFFCKTFPQHQQLGKTLGTFFKALRCSSTECWESDNYRNVLCPTIFSAILVAHY